MVNKVNDVHPDVPLFVCEPPNVRRRIRFATEGPSLTKQSFREECQISNIMRKYEKTGLLEHVNKHEGNYGDFSNHVDYLSSVLLVRNADEMFMKLPASIRRRFGNDSAEFLEFVQDPGNREAMIALGLANDERRHEDLPPEPDKRRLEDLPPEPDKVPDKAPKDD